MCELVCERALGTAGAARPLSSASATACCPLLAARRTAARARRRPEGTTAAPRPARSPRREGTEPAGWALWACGSRRTDRPTPPVRPDGSGFEPRRAAEPATSYEVPFDSVPKGVGIHSGFSARWRLQGVSPGLDSAASREGELACVKTRSGILPALSLGPPLWPSPELAHSWSLGAPPSMRD